MIVDLLDNFTSNSSQFSEEEFYAIKNMTLKKILLLITNISEFDISNTPLQYDENTVCPQPFQLSEFFMDDCTSLNTRDYFKDIGSDWMVPFIWGLVFLYIAIVILVMMLIASHNRYSRARSLALSHLRNLKDIPGDDITTSDHQVLTVTEEKAGLEGRARLVNFKVGPGKRITLHAAGVILRTIDLQNQANVTIQCSIDNVYYLVVKITNECDIIARCLTPEDRIALQDGLKAFFIREGINVTVEGLRKNVIMSNAFTKRDRQNLLENFFRAVFQQQDQPILETIRPEILECELTRSEFADAMGLKVDSQFVELMFQLIDKDGNGFISFREFLDMSVIFSKGSPEDKLKLMFDMYDVNKTGFLNREQFKKMLKSMMELVNTTVSSEPIDMVIDAMFVAAGFQNKVQLDLNDFNLLLRDHKKELSSAHMNFTGFDVEVPEVAPSKKGEELGTSLPSYMHRRDTAPSRARRTVIKAYSKKNKQEDTPEALTDSVANIRTTRHTTNHSWLGKNVEMFQRYIENNRLNIFYLSLFTLVTIGIFVERAYKYSVESEQGGLRRIAGYGVTITRGAASGMMWTYSILLITMSRNFITYLRETSLGYYVPFDSYITFHKIVALTGMMFTIVHIIGHGINFYHISTETASDLACIFREVFWRTHYLPSFLYWLFLTMTGFSSFLLTLIGIVIFIFATQYARRHAFQAFWFTHQWYILFYIFMFLHGSGRLVQDPLFGNFFLGPAIVYALDKIIGISRKKSSVAVVRAEMLPSDVFSLHIKRPSTFEYKAGQWARVACVGLNPDEYHPFTISSAPHEEEISFHIHAVGPWTHNMRELYNPANLRGAAFPKVSIDGPFGEGHQNWYQYDVSILVGGGIGVTPFASILKDIVHKKTIGARIQCKKVCACLENCCTKPKYYVIVNLLFIFF